MRGTLSLLALLKSLSHLSNKLPVHIEKLINNLPRAFYKLNNPNYFSLSSLERDVPSSDHFCGPPMDLLDSSYLFFVPREKSAIKRILVLCYISLLVLFLQWTSCPFGIYPKPKSSSNVFKQATVKI